MPEVSRVLSVGSVVSRDNIEALAVFLGVELDLAVLPIESRLRAAKLDKARLFLTFDAQLNSIWSCAPLSKRIVPIARSSTSNVPSSTLSPKSEFTESLTSLSANLQYVLPVTATGVGLPMSHIARSIM